jgi:nucleotide-binding universal stress UspA family protein
MTTNLYAANPADTGISALDSPLRRVMVAVDAAGSADSALGLAARMCAASGGQLQVVHVRLWDPPVRGCGRFYPESRQEAAAVLDAAVSSARARGVRAGGAVLDARRSQVGAAISAAACDWEADVLVLARRPGLAIARMLLGSVADQVTRTAACPCLLIRPGQRTVTNRSFHFGFRRHARMAGGQAAVSPEVQSHVGY